MTGGVLVVSLNTALDKTLVLRRLAPGTRHVPEQALDLAGGKGVNAARALCRLGVPVRLVGFLAGGTGERIEGLLEAEGLAGDWVRLGRGESRTCLTVHHGPGHPTEINEPGPVVGKRELGRLRELVARRLEGRGFLLLCGRLARGVPAGFYADLIRLARRRGVASALDASEPALSKGLAAKPDLVKPNVVELGELGLSAGRSRWKASLDALRRLGAKEAFASLGSEGALLSSEEGLFHASVPKAAGFPLGAGDTFMAGAVFGLLKGWPAERRLAFAAALATASLESLGAGVFERSRVAKVLSRVRVRRLATP